MATQVQIRGNTQATQEGRTLTSRELDINTTDSRLAVHNGSTAGGVPHVNWKDEVNQEFIYAAASGTNSITISLAKAPSTYAAGQRFVFKAAATNTGSATLNVDSLGAKTIKKKDVSGGTLSTLAAGDIIIGGIYAVYYDGTDMILESVDSGGIASVSQGDLNTSTGTLTIVNGGSISTDGYLLGSWAGDESSGTGGNSYATRVAYFDIDSGAAPTGSGTLPGGEYGFYPQMRVIDNSPGNNDVDVLVKQRYVSASPPFDLGDGEAGGFIFLKLNKSGDIISSYIADVPPWAYNGPTDIRPDYTDRVTKKKYKKVNVKPNFTLEEKLSGVKRQTHLIEITQDVKNADMDLIPHPFNEPGPDEKVIMIDPMSDVVKNCIDWQNLGDEEIAEAIVSGRFSIDNEPLNRKCPKGITAHRLIL